MTVKEFFILDWRKASIFNLLFTASILLSMFGSNLSLTYLVYLPGKLFEECVSQGFLSTCFPTATGWLLNIVYWYFLSLVIVFIYDKISTLLKI